MLKKVHSFDVFDTVLHRIYAEAGDLFFELGRRLQQTNTIRMPAESWRDLRIKAERAARADTSREITFPEIYKKIAGTLAWSEEVMQQAMQSEIALELQSLRPVPGIAVRIEELHRAGLPVLYLSDMYHSRSTIQSFLEHFGIWREKDTLYVSSETGMTKATGDLFRRCLASERIPASQLRHTGDNRHSDVLVPRRLGIEAEHFTETQLNKYEKKIQESKILPLPFRSLLAGTSRQTRLRGKEEEISAQVIWNTSSSLTGPLLFGFVWWCIESARQNSVKRLYFVARDGQVLSRVARVICEAWGYDIDCRYLYGSRHSWHFPAIGEVGENELGWIFEPTQFLSIRSVCERVNLEPVDLKDVLLEHGFSEAQWDRNLSLADRARLRETFRDEKIAARITSTAADYREKAIGYFRQEGLCDGVRFGLVDIGWNGRLQSSFSKLLASAGVYPDCGVYGFYFALVKRVKAFPRETLAAYFSDAENPSDRDYICRYPGVFELFVAADHGGTIRFEKNDRQFSPVLRSLRNDKALQWGVLTQQDGILEFARQFAQNLRKNDATPDLLLQASEIILHDFIHNPDIPEAAVYGAFPISEDQTDNVYYELAPRYRVKDSLRLLLRGRHVHHNVWFHASRLRSGFWSRLVLTQHAAYIAGRLKSVKRRICRQSPGETPGRRQPGRSSILMETDTRDRQAR